jgi:hypothetical protein
VGALTAPAASASVARAETARGISAANVALDVLRGHEGALMGALERLQSLAGHPLGAAEALQAAAACQALACLPELPPVCKAKPSHIWHL